LILTIAECGSANVGGFWGSVWGGMPRVAFSFFVGVGLYRLWLIPVSGVMAMDAATATMGAASK
jgi:hypothetical protein